MSDDPKDYNFPKGDLLRPEQIDNLGRALLSLTREICVLTDRQMVMEQVLADQGIDVREAVDSYQPDEALQTRLDAATQAIISSIVSEISGAE
ncbi:MAG: hypothetical protein Pars2KO_04710 [Parasphingorhabdus sp.]